MTCNYVKLNATTFFKSYIFHPTSKQLSPSDRKIALVASILLGVITMGIAHLICRICLYDKKAPYHPSALKAEHLARATLHLDLDSEKSNEPLPIQGQIPEWLTGDLIRNSIIKATINGESPPHSFDGLAMLHKFTFKESKIAYTNQFLDSEAYRTIREKKSFSYTGFDLPPVKSKTKHPVQNANVNVSCINGQFVAMTEIPLPVEFDPTTLNTVGVLNYQDNLRKDKCWESAHPHYDPKTKETVNLLIKFGVLNCSYIIYRIPEGSSCRQKICEIPVKNPSYMHSFSVTKDYVILTEYPLLLNRRDLTLRGKPFIRSYKWKPEEGTTFTVVNRHTGETVLRKKIDEPFFSFHHANAWEEQGKICLDLISYDDAEIVTGDALKTPQHNSKEFRNTSQLRRFSIDVATEEISSKTILNHPCEFPGINEAFEGQPNQFLYLVGFNDTNPEHADGLLAGKSLIKIDMPSKSTLKWEEAHCVPGEPIFVPNPNGSKEDEDDGVILSVVADLNKKTSFLLILNTKTFLEEGRASLPHLIPGSLHGKYFPKPFEKT